MVWRWDSTRHSIDDINTEVLVRGLWLLSGIGMAINIILKRQRKHGATVNMPGAGHPERLTIENSKF